MPTENEDGTPSTLTQQRTFTSADYPPARSIFIISTLEFTDWLGITHACNPKTWEGRKITSRAQESEKSIKDLQNGSGNAYFELVWSSKCLRNCLSLSTRVAPKMNLF